MSIGLRIVAISVLLVLAGCTSATTGEPVATASGQPSATVGAKASPPTRPTTSPTAPEPAEPGREPEAEREEPSDPTLFYGCSQPTQSVYDAVLGERYLFEPQVMVSFAGLSATIAVTIDGFDAQEVTLSQVEPSSGVLQPIDLTHEFFDTRSEEDRFNGVSGATLHHAVAVLTDDQGRSATSGCTFEVSFP